MYPHNVTYMVYDNIMTMRMPVITSHVHTPCIPVNNNIIRKKRQWNG